MLCTFIRTTVMVWHLLCVIPRLTGVFSGLATFYLYTSKTPVQLLRGGVFFSLSFLSVPGGGVGGGEVCCWPLRS